MNLPNQLTIARFFLTAAFVAVLASHWHWANTVALVLFGIASLTDYFDGEIARRYNLITDFGKLMDPLADKVMMAGAFICLIPHHAFPPWVVIVIIAREFLITGLRQLAASKGIVLPAERMGKHKTIWQIITILYFLLLLSIAEAGQAGWISVGGWWQEAWRWGGGPLIVLTTVLTLYSGICYLWRNRSLISTQ